MNLVVRPLRDTFNDLGSLTALLHAERDDLNRDERGVYDLFDELAFETDLTLVALEGIHVVGFVALKRGLSDARHHVADLRIHVARKYRGSGVGSKLLRRALFWADRNGIERTVATPYVPLGHEWRRDPKVRWFRSFGFFSEALMHKAAQLRDGSFIDAALLARTT